jgi:hypothetical protein
MEFFALGIVMRHRDMMAWSVLIMAARMDKCRAAFSQAFLIQVALETHISQ